MALEPLSKDDFAKTLAAAIQQAGETRPLRYDSETFCLTAEGEETLTYVLVNVYREYCAASKQKRQDALRPFIRSWFAASKELPTDFADVQPDLLPGVHGRSYCELYKLQMQIDGKEACEWPNRVIAEHLGLCLVYDLAESIMQVQQYHLDDWGVGFDEALAAAGHNLLEMSASGLAGVRPGVWVSPWHDNHDASRLVLLDFVRQHEVEGDPVAMIPNRDTLILTGSDDQAGLASMASWAEEGFDKPRPLSGIALRLVRTDWVPFLPSTDHSEFERFALLRIRSIGQDYADQKRLLDALHQKTGEDVFVASYSVCQSETGDVLNYCVWSEGVDALLPRAETVFFIQTHGKKEEEMVGNVGWERLVRIVGNLMERLDIYPERYRVREFPSEEQLAALFVE